MTSNLKVSEYVPILRQDPEVYNVDQDQVQIDWSDEEYTYRGEPPPDIDDLNLLMAQEADIQNNQVGGTRNKWEPLPPGPWTHQENQTIMRELTARDAREAQGIVDPPHSANYHRYLYYWIHEWYKNTTF